MTFILIAVAFPSTIVDIKYTYKIYQWDRKHIKETRKMDYLTGLFSNVNTVRDIKMFGIFNYLLEKYNVIWNEWFKKRKKILKLQNILTISLSITDEFRNSSTGSIKSGDIIIKRSVTLTIDADLHSTEDWKKSDTFIELLSVLNSLNGKLITTSGSGNEIIQINFPLSKKPPEPEHNKNGNPVCKSILVIDDDKMVSKSTEELLLSEGYTVITCNNVSDAIRNFRQKHQEIGLVLLDMRMPDMSGKELYYELKKIDSFLIQNLFFNLYINKFCHTG
jgi:CheY-like chemotaxis protein